MVVSFLGRNAASQLVYNSTEQNEVQKKWKNGPKRTLSVEEELCRSKVGLLESKI